MATQLPCRFYQHGICKLGDQCQNAHIGEPEKRPPIPIPDMNDTKTPVPASNADPRPSYSSAALRALSSTVAPQSPLINGVPRASSVYTPPALRPNAACTLPASNATPEVPCQDFQIGKCHRGAGCRFAHVEDPNFKRPACMNYLNGTCQRGGDCEYSHDEGDVGQVSLATRAAAVTTTSGPSFNTWRYDIPLDPKKARPLGRGMSRFCQGGLELVGGDANQVQDVVASLAGEGGMVRIAELLDQPYSELGRTQLARVFEIQLLPFFAMVTHTNVVTSPMLEGRVMVIFNYVYGHEGQRAVVLFNAVVKYLSDLTFASVDGKADPKTVAAFGSGFSMLSKVVDTNPTAEANADLHATVQQLSTLLESVPQSLASSFQRCTRQLQRIQQRLGLGKAAANTETQNRAQKGRPTFELARDLPGELSDDGPRHDNDKKDIRDISILPTLAEIESSRSEYLPLADPREWHIAGLEGMLDRNFRLLREDTVGQLRDAAKSELERLQNPHTQPKNDDEKRQGARTYVYSNLRVRDIGQDSTFGLEFSLAFDQPRHLEFKSKTQRKDWWEGSMRMGADALLCLLSSEGLATFFVVAPDFRQSGNRSTSRSKSGQFSPELDLWSSPGQAHIVAQLVKQDDVRLVLDQIMGNKHAQFSLVEFPGVLLPAFMPTLKALQQMSEAKDLPFADILAPTATDESGRSTEPQFPAYTTGSDFRFDLTKITKDESELLFDWSDDPQDVVAKLHSNSTLDEAQARALVASLSRQVALIQGPPGTGKSYTGMQIIRALLANKRAGDLGPIVCVTYTNHALDQGLERLFDDGVSNIVRIGGRSKSERLADINLRKVTEKLELTRTERQDRWGLLKKAQSEAQEINHIFSQLGQLANQNAVKAHIEQYYPEQHDQLFQGIDEEGFAPVNYRPDLVIENWLRSAPQSHGLLRSVQDLQEVHVEAMNGPERRVLHNSWLNEMKDELQDRLEIALASHKEIKAKLDLIKSELDLRVLRQANVIGITTSGLAKNLNLLRRLNSKVLVCEEAGEVLEAHLLTALLPSIEHAILIGDQQQLRPQVQNYGLSTESKHGGQYALDISLFERLVHPSSVLHQAQPFCTLEVQRRMHPSISKLIRDTLYPRLQDAESVSQYPEVPGMLHRLFWMHHEYLEDQDKDVQSTSHTNDFECDMTAALVSHLVKQGCYRSDDIAIITPYLGQLRKIRSKLRNRFEIVLNEKDTEDLAKEEQEESVAEDSAALPSRATVTRGTLLQALRIATVDNFQGEEAKVIVVSLVRSNKENNPGFLRTENRINVLLSRAQHGMYILGNSNTTQNVKMWSQIVDMFEKNGLLGESLELCCPRHEDKSIVVKQPEDFERLAPEAGCDLPCDKKMDCGHPCPSKCHSDLLHDAVICNQPCNRIREECPHKCPLTCGEKCHKQCQEPVDTTIKLEGCDHEKSFLPCYQFQDPSKIQCYTPTSKDVPRCGHTITVPCHVNVDSDQYRCNVKCGVELECGHICNRNCHSCRPRTKDGTVMQADHGSCVQVCDAEHTNCQHRCRSICHGDKACPPCTAKCEVRCSHSTCDKMCHEPCAPCTEVPCASHCPHSACKMPCAAPCDWLPCSKRCEKKLKCGHQCPSVCGELCPAPTFCQQCADAATQDLQADGFTGDTYSDIELSEDPCIFLDCGHVFTVSSMDKIMEMQNFYDFDDNKSCISVKTSADPFSNSEIKTCPKCPGSLRNVARYGRIVRRAMLDESTKLFIIWSNRMHQQLAERLIDEEERLTSTVEDFESPKQDIVLQNSIDDQFNAINLLQTSHRYRRIYGLRQTLRKHQNKVHTDEQPYERVRDLVETLRRKDKAPSTDSSEHVSSEVRLREHLQVLGLLIRCDIIIMTDILSVHHKASQPAKGKIQVRFGAQRDACDKVIKEAEKSKSVRQEVEFRICWAKFAAMEAAVINRACEDGNQKAPDLLLNLSDAASHHLNVATGLCHFIPKPTEGLPKEIDEVRRMLKEGSSVCQMKMVIAAMAVESDDTRHWYRCENGHPFTGGESAQSMSDESCPGCGASIAGVNHTPAGNANGVDEDEGSLEC